MKSVYIVSYIISFTTNKTIMSSIQQYVETSQKEMAKKFYLGIKEQCPDEIRQNPHNFKSFMSTLMDNTKKTLYTTGDAEKMRIFGYMLECYNEDFGEPGSQ